MYIELTITAVADRDPSCNLFTFNETHAFAFSDGLPPLKIKSLCERHKEKFLAAWPHPRTAKPSLIPIDASVRVKEGRRP